MSAESAEQSDRDTDRESYLRWQEIAITQLGYTINLMMTLSGGALTFVVKEKLDGVLKRVDVGGASRSAVSDSPFSLQLSLTSLEPKIFVIPGERRESG